MATNEPPQPNSDTTVSEPVGSGRGTAAVVVRSTAILTLVIKVFGLFMAANEAFLVDPPRDPVILGVAAFMMAGATGVDSLVNAVFGNKQ